MSRRDGMVLAMSLGLAAAQAVAAQDSVPARATFAVDASRGGAFRSTYDILVVTGDSAQVIGRRTLDVMAATYAEQQGWLLIETRTGAVAAVESLYVSQDMRALRWSASQGPAMLAMVFARDSVFGATSAPGGRQSVLAPVPAKLIVSTAMLEALLPLLPLSAHWRDSVSVLAVGQASTAAVPAELAVVGMEEGSGDWIVALRAPTHTLVAWVSRESGRLVRTQQPVPLHTASLLEYRPAAAAP